MASQRSCNGEMDLGIVHSRVLVRESVGSKSDRRPKMMNAEVGVMRSHIKEFWYLLELEKQRNRFFCEPSRRNQPCSYLDICLMRLILASRSIRK